MVAFQQTLPSNTCRMPNPGYHIFLKMSDCSTTPAVNLREDISTFITDPLKGVHYIHNVWEKGEKRRKKETVLDQYKIRNTATDTVMQYELTRDELSHQFS